MREDNSDPIKGHPEPNSVSSPRQCVRVLAAGRNFSKNFSRKHANAPNILRIRRCQVRTKASHSKRYCKGDSPIAHDQTTVGFGCPPPLHGKITDCCNTTALSLGFSVQYGGTKIENKCGYCA